MESWVPCSMRITPTLGLGLTLSLQLLSSLRTTHLLSHQTEAARHGHLAQSLTGEMGARGRVSREPSAVELQSSQLSLLGLSADGGGGGAHSPHQPSLCGFFLCLSLFICLLLSLMFLSLCLFICLSACLSLCASPDVWLE